jgi:hypothetical protein
MTVKREINIVQLGSSPKHEFQFGPKLNTEVAFNTTTHPPKTFGPIGVRALPLGVAVEQSVHY